MKENQLYLAKLKERYFKLTVLIEESKRESRHIRAQIKALNVRKVSPKSMQNLKPIKGKDSA